MVLLYVLKTTIDDAYFTFSRLRVYKLIIDLKKGYILMFCNFCLQKGRCGNQNFCIKLVCKKNPLRRGAWPVDTFF